MRMRMMRRRASWVGLWVGYRIAVRADESHEAVVPENLNSESAGELTVLYGAGTKI